MLSQNCIIDYWRNTMSAHFHDTKHIKTEYCSIYLREYLYILKYSCDYQLICQSIHLFSAFCTSSFMFKSIMHVLCVQWQSFIFVVSDRTESNMRNYMYKTYLAFDWSWYRKIRLFWLLSLRHLTFETLFVLIHLNVTTMAHAVNVH